MPIAGPTKSNILWVMTGRWVQENAFKHDAVRWGINQLDRRKVEPYPPDAAIPKPARRRVDRAAVRSAHVFRMGCMGCMGCGGAATAAGQKVRQARPPSTISGD